MNAKFANLLGLRRINLFKSALAEALHAPQSGSLGTLEVVVAVLIGIIPLLPGAFHFSTTQIDFPTLLVGTATCLAIIYRKRLGITLPRTSNWKSALSLTHTGFALGCIPAVFLMVIAPDAFTQVAQLKPHAGGVVAEPPQYMFLRILLSISLISLWAGITEEFVYRGLVTSAVRRWKLLKSARLRNILAVTLSSLLFGLSHYGTWGPAFSIALVGIGMGLGFAYLAIDERLLPVVVYHVAFDFLSLSFAAFFSK